MMTMSTLKKILTALAATIVALAAAEASGTIDIIPAKAMHWMTQGAVILGIFGASPLGRIIFADAASNDIVPPAERGAADKSPAPPVPTKP